MRSKRKSTKYIRLDTSKCEACWDCIDACEYGVLGKLNVWFHKHVVVTDPENCRGCKSCIKACPNGVFEFIHRPEKGGDDGPETRVAGGPKTNFSPGL